MRLRSFKSPTCFVVPSIWTSKILPSVVVWRPVNPISWASLSCWSSDPSPCFAWYFLRYLLLQVNHRWKYPSIQRKRTIKTKMTIINGSETLRGSIVMAYFVLLHSNGFFFLFVSSRRKQQRSKQSKKEASLEHNNKSILVNFNIQLIFCNSQRTWTKTWSVKTNREKDIQEQVKTNKRTLKRAKNGNQQNELCWICFNSCTETFKRYMKAIPYKTASKQFERFTQFYFFAILLSS